MGAITNQQVFLNKFSIDFMIWEINPMERNKNNVVKFYLSEKSTIKEGCIIIGDYNEYGISVYEIEKIQETKQGSVFQKKIHLRTNKMESKKSFFFQREKFRTNKQSISKISRNLIKSNNGSRINYNRTSEYRNDLSAR